MRNHTRVKKLFAWVIISLTTLATLAQVTVAGQSAKPFVAAMSPEAGSSAQTLRAPLPGIDSAEDVAVGNHQGNALRSGLIVSSASLFSPVVIYDSGGVAPSSIAVADVNGDGRPDIVVATNTVGVLLGNGDGTFKAAVTYGSGGRGVVSVAVADVNGDGKPDVVVANFCASSNCIESTVGVLLGNGDGTFQAVVTYDSGGNEAASIAVADVNRDRPTRRLAGQRRRHLSVTRDLQLRRECPLGGGGRFERRRQT
jgi:FG-GAP-like repeat